MTTDDHRRMDAARIRAGLSVHDLWLRYLALGGSDDAFGCFASFEASA